jgi:hypothetical protein
MLAHSPPLPLIIEYFYPDSSEEEGLIFALEERHRVRRVRLQMPALNLQKLIMTIDEEYPVLEYLILMPSPKDKSAALMLPETFQAPHLRHLYLRGFVLPTGSRMLTTAVGLVTLALFAGHPSTYFQPSTLIHWISFMPQLEMLRIVFSSPVPGRDVERRLMHMPIMTHVTLPNLRWVFFLGVSAYLEAVVRRIAAPHLEKLKVTFFKQLTFSVPGIQQFLNTTENLSFDSAFFEFRENQVYMNVYLGPAKMRAISIRVFCWHLDWQVSSVAQISNSLGPIFSTVEGLTLEHEVHSQSSEEHNEVDPTEWRKLLKSFSNVKKLRVDDGLIEELGRSLRPDDGEPPLELLPELQELSCSRNGDIGDAFASFIDARQNAGRPALVRNPSGLATPLL